MSQKSLPLGLPSPDEVRVQRELAVECFNAGRIIFNAFLLWLELQVLNQVLIGKGYLNGQFPYSLALQWTWGRWSDRRVDLLVKKTLGVFFDQPKPGILRLRSLKKVCVYFHVIPLESWRRVPLAKFRQDRHAAVRLVMTLHAKDAPPKVRDKPRPKITRRANTGVPERTQYYDEKKLGVRTTDKNWRKNDGDDWEMYPLHQIGKSYAGFGLTGPVGRIRHVQVAMLGASCLIKGDGKGNPLRTLRQRWPKRYFKTAKSLRQAQRHQDSQEGRGVPSGLVQAILPQHVHSDSLYLIPREDRLRSKAREWRGL